MVLRGVVLVGISAFLLYGDYPQENLIPILVIMGIELVLFAGSLFMARIRAGDNSVFNLVKICVEVGLFSLLTRFTGGMTSDFYLFFFISVTLGAYIMSSSAIIIYTGILSISYVLVNINTISDITPIGLSLRFAVIWFYALSINHISEHIRHSETRLLKVFDTLNRRTSELEKIHVQLEMVYENSRILAGILDFDQIVNEILKIGEIVLDYPALGIVLIGPGENLIFRGRLVGGQKNIRLKALPKQSMELAYRVARDSEPVRLMDMSKRLDYDPMMRKAKSAMLVPMITYGKTTGLLIAESPRQGAFDEKDENFLSVLARSSAMALENAILHRKTEELTIIDDLTGVFNFRYFSEKIKEEKKRAVRYNQALSLIMLDIDWFKRFNDNYGHEVGNRVLVGLVGVIKGCIRDVDILCRYGGEEFIIILPNTVEREAYRIAERIRSEVESAEFGGGEGIPKLKVTVSVGISSFPENGLAEEELVNAVDQAMYRAKGSGKNAVCTV